MAPTTRRTPLLLLALIGLLMSVVAMPASAEHPGPIPQDPQANQPVFWQNFGAEHGEEWICEDAGFSGDSYTLGAPPEGYVWRLLVVKAGSGDGANELHWDPAPGDSFSHSRTGDVSHITLCRMEAPRTGAILLEKVGFGGGPLTAADGVEFTLYDEDDTAIPMPETSTAGTFCAEDLAFGTYTISETGVPDNYLPLEDFTAAVDDDGTCDDPTVAFVDEDAIVNAAAPGDVIIEKVDGDGLPLAGATFRLTGTDYDESCTTDASGECSFTEVPAGTDYVLDETGVPAGYTIGDVTLNGDPVTLPHTFDITPDTDLEFVFAVENLEIEVGAWCSPGFWRNSPLAVAETGVDMTQSYNALFDPDVSPNRKAQRGGAVDDPTLQEVLDNPQWYGGGAFNNVGDLLSAAHPDVDFTGERIEDSCPLAADASGVRG